MIYCIGKNCNFLPGKKCTLKFGNKFKSSYIYFWIEFRSVEEGGSKGGGG